jgi:Xaa-Pro aminopeptidase
MSDLGRVLAEHRLSTVEIDLDRMVRERHVRIQDAMAVQGIDVALLLHGPHVAYATGFPARGLDESHAVFRRPVAMVVAGEDRPHLLWDEAEPPGVGDAEPARWGSEPAAPGAASTASVQSVAGCARRHPAAWPELDEGAERLAKLLGSVAGSVAGRRVAVDELTGAMRRMGLLDGATVVDASAPLAAARVTKTSDELACIAEAQRRNEAAMRAVPDMLLPGATRSHVAGEFLARLQELDGEADGAAVNLIDPIFQPMPRTVAAGPRTTTGGVAFPIGVGDPKFAEGDLVWVDTGIDHCGYASDFGRTWLVGRDPTAAERRLFERWCDVMLATLDVLGPGVTAGQLCRAAEAATDGTPPWLPHFYLAHGVGVESAEMPLVGTDLGREFDDGLILAPGMVLVLEPAVWHDGVGGYRAEEIVAVTEEGWCHLGGGYPYTPFAL